MNKYQEALNCIFDYIIHTEPREKLEILQQLIDYTRPVEFEDLEIGIEYIVKIGNTVHKVKITGMKDNVICLDNYVNLFEFKDIKFFCIPKYMKGE